MEELFDKRQIENIEVTEAYIYSNSKMHTMSKEALENELELVKKDIETIQHEIDENAKQSVPSYILKERLKDAITYQANIKKTLQKKMNESTETEEKKDVDPLKRFKDMKKDLERQYEKGIISKDYLDKYMAKIDAGMESYKIKLERDKEEEKKRKDDESKKHKFKLFKKNLSDYKK